MSMKDGLVGELMASKEFFERSTRCLVEADAEFRATPDTFTVRQQVAHAAHTIEWFLDGGFGPNGFNMDFSKHIEELDAAKTLGEARAWFNRAIEKAIAAVKDKAETELMEPLPPGPVMGGAPRMMVFHAMVEHTAHHRGALTVYSRLIGHVPQMPYMEA